MDADRRHSERGFDELLLGGVILLMVTGAGLGVGLYLLPREPLTVPELRPAVRVARETDFPVGTSRVQNWGDQIILIVRTEEEQYFALEGTSPLDGCILRWDLESLRVVSPCTYVVYDLHGNVVAGLTTVPLHRYAVLVRDGLVYVTGG